MGELILQDSGPVYLDTQIVIYSVEKHPVYAPFMRSFWERVETESIPVCASELSLLEALVIPLRNADKELADAYLGFFNQPEVQMIPITREVLLEAAQLRATFPAVRTPDAIHAASARRFGCSTFVTNDKNLSQISGLAVAFLGDVVNSQ